VLKISFINVGYGEGILLEASETDSAVPPFVILIDGGSAEDEEYAGNTTGRIRAEDYLARRGITSLDLAVITHVHEDHVPGLEGFFARGGTIKNLWTTALIPAEYAGVQFSCNGCPCSLRKFLAALNSYNRLLRALEKTSCVIQEINAPQSSVALTKQLSVDVVSPAQDNARELVNKIRALYSQNTKHNSSAEFFTLASRIDSELNAYSLVLRFLYGGRRIFLPGDATPNNAPHPFGKEFLGADILKLAHHGQRDSITEDFIRAVSPHAVVTCSSSDRRYDSAHPDVYRAIESALGRTPVYLFSDDIDIKANLLTKKPHEAVVVTIGEEAEGEIRYDVSDE
jgi:competence protein ComEC